jgi:hypothetical protein
MSHLSFEKQRKQVQISWMDANLIWVAQECRDTGRLACLYFLKQYEEKENYGWEFRI